MNSRNQINLKTISDTPVFPHYKYLPRDKQQYWNPASVFWGKIY